MMAAAPRMHSYTILLFNAFAIASVRVLTWSLAYMF